MTAMMIGAATATATTTVTMVMATTMTMISQSYGDWQIPALGSKGAAITLFLFKCSHNFKSDGNNDSNSNSSSNSDSDSNTDKYENDTSFTLILASSSFLKQRCSDNIISIQTKVHLKSDRSSNNDHEDEDDDDDEDDGDCNEGSPSYRAWLVPAL